MLARDKRSSDSQLTAVKSFIFLVAEPAVNFKQPGPAEKVFENVQASAARRSRFAA
jgi:hypothetical protein